MPARSTRRKGLRVSVVLASENVARMRNSLEEEVLDLRFVVLLLAELAAESGDQSRRQLVANRHLGPGGGVARRLNLEDLQSNRPLDCAQERSRQKPRGQSPSSNRELLLLRRRELIERRVEHNERQNVGIVERRGARQSQLGLVERTDDPHADLDAGDHPLDCDVQLGIQVAAEVDRADWIQIESTTLEGVGADQGVERAGDEQGLRRILLQV